ncbi:MAG: HD domain-containing protein [Vampirovibrionia bacterium]
MKKLDSIRKKTIEALLIQHETEHSHCKQVTKLALQIFDNTKGILHKYGDKERELLEIGSLLHDIGYSISFDKHSKHSYNIIINSAMAGFDSNEITIIANIARYHNGKPPKKSHENYNSIKDKKIKTIIKDLSAILRIADGLDRSHCDAVKNIKCLVDSFSGTCAFVITVPGGNCHTELYGVNKKKELFEKQFNVDIKFIVQNN